MFTYQIWSFVGVSNVTIRESRQLAFYNQWSSDMLFTYQPYIWAFLIVTDTDQTKNWTLNFIKFQQYEQLIVIWVADIMIHIVSCACYEIIAGADLILYIQYQIYLARGIIIIIMSRRLRGYPWPSLAISPYHSSPPAGLQDYRGIRKLIFLFSGVCDII